MFFMCMETHTLPFMANIIGIVSGGQLLRYEYNGKTISLEQACTLRQQGVGYEQRDVGSAELENIRNEDAAREAYENSLPKDEQ